MVSDLGELLSEGLGLLLASCHGLARMADGTLVGDPLDQRLFEATGWELVDDDDDDDARHKQATAIPGGGAAEAEGRVEVDGGGGVDEGVVGQPWVAHTSVRPPGSQSPQVFDVIKRCEGCVRDDTRLSHLIPPFLAHTLYLSI